MSYQIPRAATFLQLRSTGKVPLYQFTPAEDVKLKHIVVTMFLKDLISSDFKMKINVYFDDKGRQILFSSEEVKNFDIVRVGDYYCEIRFDFPVLKNLLTIGHEYYVEFELYGTYNIDENNYIGLILDHDSPLAILAEGKSIIRYSAFYEKA